MRNQLRKKSLRDSSLGEPIKGYTLGSRVVGNKRKREAISESSETDDSNHTATGLDMRKMEKIDPLLAAEEKEIKRLERLLGIKTRKY
jgi:hypothetical protein